jgi:hypothetical protein
MYRDVVLSMMSKWDAGNCIRCLHPAVQKESVVLWKKVIGSSQVEVLEAVLLQ